MMLMYALEMTLNVMQKLSMNLKKQLLALAYLEEGKC